METNKAPNKIYLYLSDRAGEDFDNEWGIMPLGEDSIEYTRTDALIEVKEVDLDAEIMKYQREIYDRDTTVRDIAKHFFELGLKINKFASVNNSK